MGGIGGDAEVVLPVVAHAALPAELGPDDIAAVARCEELVSDVDEPECVVLLHPNRHDHRVERDDAEDGGGDLTNGLAA